MDLDVGIIDDIVEKVESDIMPMVQDIAQKGQRYIPGRWLILLGVQSELLSYL